ncbi:MAG: 4-(cytidine 5'-diphospho)-2-C-methyl-D-erythritol kinase [Cyanobacteria bacterium P01_D01_bin.128]
MRLYSLSAAAKINLYLEIVGDRADGFHELVMIMQSVSLCDRVTVRSLGTDVIRVRCDHPLVPTDKTNLAYRAAELLIQTFPNILTHNGGVEITIEKQIPVGAGLAGGSSNAAAVLIGLDLLWKLGLTQNELQTLAAKLGSDVPFCIKGGTAIATGRGDVLDPLPDLGNWSLVLAKYHSLSISTPWAYKGYRQQFSDRYIQDQSERQARQQRIRASGLVGGLSESETAKALTQELHNDLEKVILSAYPKVAQLKETLAGLGGMGTLMSGSGPTVFTLCETPEAAAAIAAELRHQTPDSDLGIWCAQFMANGIQLMD